MAKTSHIFYKSFESSNFCDLTSNYCHSLDEIGNVSNDTSQYDLHKYVFAVALCVAMK